MGETFKISDLAQEFLVTTRSIRFYEDMGLLHPQRRGTVRVYDHKDKTRLKLILRGKRLGFSLAEIRELFELYDAHQGQTQLQRMLLIIEDKQRLLRTQMDDIRIVMVELEQAKQRCQSALDRPPT